MRPHAMEYLKPDHASECSRIIKGYVKKIIRDMERGYCVQLTVNVVFLFISLKI